MLYVCALKFVSCLMDLSRPVPKYPSLPLPTLFLTLPILLYYLEYWIGGRALVVVVVWDSSYCGVQHKYFITGVWCLQCFNYTRRTKWRSCRCYVDTSKLNLDALMEYYTERTGERKTFWRTCPGLVYQQHNRSGSL